MITVQQNFRTPGFRVWTQDQCYELHLKSLEILERTGIVVHDEAAATVYKNGGAYVKGTKVFIPAWMVEEALRTAPGRIVINGRDGRRVSLEKNQVNYGTGTEMPSFRDFRTGEYRSSVLQDVVDAALVADYLPNIDYVAPMGLASEHTPELTDLYHFKAMQENSVKPVFTTAIDQASLQGLIDMAAAIAGDYNELKLHPLFMTYTQPISPLVHTKEALQKLMLASKYSIPITHCSGLQSGSTAPVTMAGAMALGNAECLAGLVLHQLINPGAPFVYGICATVTDMATMLGIYGGPEMPLYHCAVGEMGRFYKLPSFGTAGCTESATIDQQAAIDATFSILVAALAGNNWVHDCGYMANGLAGSLDYIVFCDECISMTKHYMRGITITPETLALDLIDQVGPGGNYLAARHTLKHFKEVDWFPRYSNRKSYHNWVADGRITMNERIKIEVEKILASHKPQPIPDRISSELDLIIRDNEKRVLLEKE